MAAGRPKNLVLIGGGHAQVYVLERLARRPEPRVHITLIARDVLTPYSGMLPGFIAGHYAASQCYVDLAPLAERAGARLVHDEAIGLDRAARKVLCRGGAAIDYDIAAFDIGATPDLRQVPGAERFATPVKPISTFRARWEAILARAGREEGPTRFLTVGGGAAGVELTLAMRHRLRTIAQANRRAPDTLSFTLVTKRAILEDHNASVQRRFARVLAERDVRVIEHDPVRSVEEAVVVCASGRCIGYDELIWVTEAGGAPWLAGTGLALDRAGFIVVDATLCSVTDARIFAVGDVAANRDHPRPKAGVFAVRQGPPLAENLVRALSGENLLPFIPQRAFLSLITTGDRYAIASRGNWSAEGRLVWWLKDQIDRHWMRRWRRP